jgi:hypothetical protein
MNAPRTLVIVLGVALASGGVALMLHGPRPAGLYLLVLGVTVLLGTLLERWRYRPVAPRASAGWKRTDERFLDPTTGRRITVYYDAASGERHYVDDQAIARPHDPC